MINLNTIFLIHIFTCFYMTGVIWLIQIIHYPLFNHVGSSEWKIYHAKHLQLTTIAIAGPMFLELITLGVLFYLRPSFRSNSLMLASAFLLFIIWVTTFLISVPTHNKLVVNLNEVDIHHLVKTNWIRTIAWSLKSIILLYQLNLSLSL